MITANEAKSISKNIYEEEKETFLSQLKDKIQIKIITAAQKGLQSCFISNPEIPSQFDEKDLMENIITTLLNNGFSVSYDGYPYYLKNNKLFFEGVYGEIKCLSQCYVKW